ncbi:UV damage repair endonuclease [Fimicolochytrium jonesii]|uniref:UV damage repair endonuclease n=1 Tax=Fimicolochytrium jonesii TaxID=1396493 RepID=UPI0022FEFED9|nr:UV damage repair endonuclease [Fimicolochytrium jonesii]KAI8820773.1 UV damage repair endonuclease [Fimicolochytrium jonesii]
MATLSAEGAVALPKRSMSNLTTTYHGRLGYACLNTVLRAQNPAIFCSRTCRLATAKEKGQDYLNALCLANAKNILPMLKWNDANSIKFMRLSSEMMPFASHPEVGYSIYDVPGLVEVLEEVGAYAKAKGHRLTCHPGQYCQLASPREIVFENALLELRYHCDMLDIIGLGKESVMIIHGGGVYGDKAATLLRFRERWKLVPEDIQKRIVLENDEMCYSVEDLLPICEDLDIPLVLDWHHAAINPSEHPSTHYLPRIDAIWHRRGIKPKQHHSEGRPGAETMQERRAHSARIERLPPCQDNVDLMIEAKDKEQAVLQLFRQYGLQPVADEYPISLERQAELAKLAKRANAKITLEVDLKVEVDEGGNEIAKPKSPPKKRKASIKKRVRVTEEEEDDVDEEERTIKPVRNPRKKVKDLVIEEKTEVEEGPTQTRGGRTVKKVVYTEKIELDEEEQAEVAKAAPKRRKVATKAKTVGAETPETKTGPAKRKRGTAKTPASEADGEANIEESIASTDPKAKKVAPKRAKPAQDEEAATIRAAAPVRQSRRLSKPRSPKLDGRQSRGANIRA